MLANDCKLKKILEVEEASGTYVYVTVSTSFMI